MSNNAKTLEKNTQMMVLMPTFLTQKLISVFTPRKKINVYYEKVTRMDLKAVKLKTRKIESISHKFLLVDHTQKEGDSMHALIDLLIPSRYHRYS